MRFGRQPAQLARFSDWKEGRSSFFEKKEPKKLLIILD
jgi:hypothetical protein